MNDCAAEMLSAESIAAAAAPEMATTVACRVVRVIDGDTVEVVVQQVYRVRLLDAWSPEAKGASKEAGLTAKEHLRAYIERHGLDATLSVPWSEDSAKSWSLGRVLGRIWLRGQNRSLSEVQCDAGHATPAKV